MKQMVISFQGYIGEYCKKSSANRYAAYMQSSSATRPGETRSKDSVLKSEQLKANAPLPIACCDKNVVSDLDIAIIIINTAWYDDEPLSPSAKLCWM